MEQRAGSGDESGLGSGYGVENELSGAAEISSGRDQTENEVAVGGEVVEVAGMDEDMVIAEELNGEILIREMDRARRRTQAEDGVPPGVGIKEFGDGMRSESGLELRAIFADAHEELGAERMALGEQHGERGLCWRAEREIRVGDDFEALEGRADKSGTTGDGKPGDFHLRQRGDFGEAAESEGER